MTTATKTTKTTKTVTCDCPKCGGRGYIEAFSGIANGVCFTCNGAGKKTYKVGKEPKKPTVNEYTANMVSQILNGTDEQFSKMTYSQLAKFRDIAHGGFGVQQVYPQLLEFWFANFECYFQARQQEKLDSYYA